MEITKADERNIRHFAFRYSKLDCSVEDLIQEGRIAMLEAKVPEHKYWRMVNAIAEYARKNTVRIPIDHNLQNYKVKAAGSKADTHDYEVLGETDPALKQFEDTEFVKNLLEKANLDIIQRTIIELMYYDNESITDIATALNQPRTNIRRWHTEALTTLRKIAEKELV